MFNPPPVAQQIETSSAVIVADPKGFIRVTMKHGATDTLGSAAENVKGVVTLNHRRKWPLLVDTRPLKGQEKAARDYYSGTFRIGIVSAQAILVDSILATAIGNAVLAVSSVMPVKLFRDELSALAWFKSLEAKAAKGAACVDCDRGSISDSSRQFASS